MLCPLTLSSSRDWYSLLKILPEDDVVILAVAIEERSNLCIKFAFHFLRSSDIESQFPTLGFKACLEINE